MQVESNCVEPSGVESDRIESGRLERKRFLPAHAAQAPRPPDVEEPWAGSTESGPTD